MTARDNRRRRHRRHKKAARRRSATRLLRIACGLPGDGPRLSLLDVLREMPGKRAEKRRRRFAPMLAAICARNSLLDDLPMIEAPAGSTHTSVLRTPPPTVNPGAALQGMLEALKRLP